MQNITFEQLPTAVAQLFEKLEGIEQLLLATNSQPAVTNDELLTIQQAAELLNLAVPTVYGLVSRSEIPYSKKGKKLYFTKQELLDWVQSGRKKTTSEIQSEATNYINRKSR